MQTFWQLITEAAARAPTRVVLADDHGRTLTTSRLGAAAEHVAAGLGIRPGTVVSWQLPTTIEGVVVLAALARAGTVQNPIIPILREREVGLITRAVATEVFITAETWRGFDHAGMARDLGIDVVSIDLEGGVGPDLRLPMADPSGLPAPPRSSTECRWLYFSSGTTADPKGARHRDESVMASARGMNEHLGFGDGDVYPIAFPITLGEQATSALLLWATEAKACGSNLTRQCMVNALSKVHC